MAKIQLQVEELIAWIANEDSEKVREVKEKVATAMLDVWGQDPIFRSALYSKAEQLAEEKIRRHIRDAFQENKDGWGSNARRTISGWAADIVRDEVKSAVAKAIKTDEYNVDKMFKDIMRLVANEYLDEWKVAYTKTMDSVPSLVHEEIAKQLPKLVTDSYKERVAEHFDKHKLEDFAAELVQKAIGAMLINGTIQIGTIQKTV
ncbi:hypothetical protein [Paenibacillus macerans]|uniref:hypothetical protein n=1 Tax=Paenibacillus macerans TaxID=44252 RepID=UPI00203E2FB5|nr:hypothetical protein [Paenibacillus macerans]MCM3699216.1 hypothetical protein [Paenibacillus macerans]